MRLGPAVFRIRHGFSIIEIVVAVTAVAIIAATIFFTVNPEAISDATRIAGVAQNLDDLMQAIAGSEVTLPAVSFRQVVGVYPGHLSDLTSALTPLQAGISSNSCGQFYSGTQTTNAATKSPYYPVEFQTTGTKLASGFVANDALVRADPTATTRSTLAIQFLNVTSDDAQALDAYMDGVADGANGAIRYVANGTNPVTVSFLIAVRGC